MPAVEPHPPTSGADAPGGARPLRVALIGHPNVGKSVLFNRLTGSYVTVSNYPGTSVEVARGRGGDGPIEIEILDTPGLYSLLPSTDEERVSRRILLRGEADLVVQVVEARSLHRTLPLTFQLLETGLPLVVALNMMDEAEGTGLSMDLPTLAERLGVEVVPTVAVEGRGVEELSRAIARAVAAPRAPAAPQASAPQAAAPEAAAPRADAPSAARGRAPSLAYGNGLGEAVARVREVLRGAYAIDPVAVASLLLQEDPEVRELVAATEGDGGLRAFTAALEAAGGFETPAAYRLAVERRHLAEAVAGDAVSLRNGRAERWTALLGRLLARPLTGIPFLLLVLYLGLYQFVGVFGAGTVVDWLEGAVFEARVNPLLERLFAGVSWEWLRDLFVGEYGVLTLGVRYAVAIILPIVGTFFLFFSVLEDSGYFPRLALLVDRTFKRLGLNGRAVIPIVLGFACDTMATMVTRTLETRKERVLATLLLALAIPCSAQLGVIVAVLAGHPAALGVWGGAVLGTFLAIGALAARVLPGESGRFYMELPPLRRPRLGNVLTKTLTRMHWYFMEVLPLFLLASVLLWAGELTGALRRVLGGLAPVVAALGLPEEAASVFLFGFFRRDYGAAGLFDLNGAGALDPVQLTVAAVTLTLFVPCVAQFLMMLKERGVRTATAMLGFATVYAFGAGFLLNLFLRGLGW